MCGGGDSNMGIHDTAAPISSAVGSHVKAMIWMGNPRHTPGASYNKGTSNSPGVCTPQHATSLLGRNEC